MMCARRATVSVLADSLLNTRPAGARRIVLQCVVGLIVSVAAVLGPSPLMAGTMTITANTTLTTDNVGAIVIGADFVVLDCAGHTITNPGGDAITLNRKSGVTVKNCVVTNALNGIVLNNSIGNVLEGNTARGNSGFGVRLENRSNGNHILHNTFAGNRLGLSIDTSLPNTIYNNNFLDNTVQAAVSGSPAWHIFDILPDGGNYWLDFDSLAEGCSDTNPSDGFCDNPKVVTGGQDDLPLTTPYGSAVTTAAYEICHVPPGNSAARHTITIGAPAWPAHQAHGDTQGRCQ